MTDFPRLLSALISGRSLGEQGAEELLTAMIGGSLTPAQVAAALVAWRMKGESEEELLGAVRAVRARAQALRVSGPLLDTCGTGGDQRRTFNVSTAAALVAAAAGVRVAKHGNRSASGSVGSADVLESLGMVIDLEPAQVEEAIEKFGFGFLFAPRFHPAMRHVAPVRRELGVRTIFNLIGPLSNPAGAAYQLVGVFAREWLRPVAEVLARLGARHVLVVHSADGLDEISIAAPTFVVEWNGADLREYEVVPEAFGIARRHLEEVVCADLAQARERMQEVLRGGAGACTDFTTLNAGAALYAAGQASSLVEGVEHARQVLASGAAWAKLAELVKWSQR